MSALSASGVTNSDGRWQFAIPRTNFSGGDVLFSFEQGGSEAGVVVPRLPGSINVIELDFVQSPSGEFRLETITDKEGQLAILQPTPVVPDTQAPDTQAEACEFVATSGIAILEEVPEIVEFEDPAQTGDCESNVIEIILIGNPGRRDVEYRVESNRSFIFFEPEERRSILESGDIKVVRARRNCSFLRDPFNYTNSPPATGEVSAEIRVSIEVDTIILPSGDIVSKEALAAECGPGTSLSDLKESVRIPVRLILKGL